MGNRGKQIKTRKFEEPKPPQVGLEAPTRVKGRVIISAESPGSWRMEWLTP